MTEDLFNTSERRKWEFTVPYFPPSVNKLYFKNKWGGLNLTKEARGFLAQFSEHMMRNYLPMISTIDRRVTRLYEVQYDFYFPRERVCNTTYGSARGAKTPFARMDVENLLKLLSDAFSEAISVDDSQFVTVSATKHVARDGTPRIVIRLTRVDPWDYGFRI